MKKFFRQLVFPTRTCNTVNIYKHSKFLFSENPTPPTQESNNNNEQSNPPKDTSKEETKPTEENKKIEKEMKKAKKQPATDKKPDDPATEATLKSAESNVQSENKAQKEKKGKPKEKQETQTEAKVESNPNETSSKANSSNNNKQINSKDQLIASEKFKSALNNFRKNWPNVSVTNEEQKLDEISKGMTLHQIQYLRLLADKFLGLNVVQMKYFNSLMEEHASKTLGLTNMELNTDMRMILNDYEPVNPGFFKQHEQMATFTEWLRSKAEPSAAPIQQEAPKEEKKAEKKEEKKEKEFYDVELSSFDAAKKIVLIKEVKNMLNLGLKEAKELVEKAPVIVLKNMKKADCEEKMSKLKENGGNLKLV